MQAQDLADTLADDGSPAAGGRAAKGHTRRPAVPGGLDKYVAILIFLAGLLVGWLAIGWWLWPARVAGCAPWELEAGRQGRYVTLVAADLARNGSLTQAKKDLAGWNAEALAALLTTIERESASPEARESLAALREALALPDSPPSLLTTLLRQRAVFWSAALALVLLAAAAALAIAPPRYGRRAAERGLEQLAEDDADGPLAARGTAAPKPWLQGLDDDSAQAQAASSPAQKQAEQQDAAQAQGQQAGSQPAPARQVQRVRLSDGDSGPADATAAGSKQEGSTAAAGPDGGKGNDSHSAAPEQGQDPGHDVQAAEGDAPETSDPQAILSELLGDVDFMDPRREALVKIADGVDIGDLVVQSNEALAQLQRIPHRRSLEAG